MKPGEQAQIVPVLPQPTAGGIGCGCHGESVKGKDAALCDCDRVTWKKMWTPRRPQRRPAARTTPAGFLSTGCLGEKLARDILVFEPPPSPVPELAVEAPVADGFDQMSRLDILAAIHVGERA